MCKTFRSSWSIGSIMTNIIAKSTYQTVRQTKMHNQWQPPAILEKQCQSEQDGAADERRRRWRRLRRPLCPPPLPQHADGGLPEGPSSSPSPAAASVSPSASPSPRTPARPGRHGRHGHRRLGPLRLGTPWTRSCRISARYGPFFRFWESSVWQGEKKLRNSGHFLWFWRVICKFFFGDDSFFWKLVMIRIGILRFFV